MRDKLYRVCVERVKDGDMSTEGTINDEMNFYARVGWNRPPYSHDRRDQLVHNLCGFRVHSSEDRLIKTYNNAMADRYSSDRKKKNEQDTKDGICETGLKAGNRDLPALLAALHDEMRLKRTTPF